MNTFDSKRFYFYLCSFNYNAVLVNFKWFFILDADPSELPWKMRFIKWEKHSLSLLWQQPWIQFNFCQQNSLQTQKFHETLSNSNIWLLYKHGCGLITIQISVIAGKKLRQFFLLLKMVSRPQPAALKKCHLCIPD